MPKLYTLYGKYDTVVRVANISCLQYVVCHIAYHFRNKMGRRCCVTGYKSGYETSDKICMYHLPKDSEERERWLKSIPRDNIPQSKDIVLCEKHWPINFEKVLVYGKYRPAVPPTVFNCIPKSLVPTTISKKRVTQRAISSKRNLTVDELDEFTKTDFVAKFDVEALLKKVNSTLFRSQVISFVSNSSIVIQSSNIKSGIPLFTLNRHNNFKFDCYRLGVRYFNPSLSQNKIVKMNRWSVLEEAFNYLSKVETSHKNEVLNDNRDAMSSASSVGSIVYSPAT